MDASRTVSLTEKVAANQKSNFRAVQNEPVRVAVQSAYLFKMTQSAYSVQEDPALDDPVDRIQSI